MAAVWSQRGHESLRRRVPGTARSHRCGIDLHVALIISHRHRFIFLKTRKTAGTSLEIALAAHCGPLDVITPITSRDEELRRRLRHRGPQNYLAGLRDYGALDVVRALAGRPKWRFFNHAPGDLVRREVGEDVWKSYFKFCFVRNPWDKIVSLFYWDRQFDTHRAADFSTYMRRTDASDYRIYTEDDEVTVDAICRFEDLEVELDRLATKLDLDFGRLPEAKTDVRPRHKHYSEYFSDADAAYVGERYATEIRLHGYRFERP